MTGVSVHRKKYFCTNGCSYFIHIFAQREAVILEMIFLHEGGSSNRAQHCVPASKPPFSQTPSVDVGLLPFAFIYQKMPI